MQNEKTQPYEQYLQLTKQLRRQHPRYKLIKDILKLVRLLGAETASDGSNDSDTHHEVSTFLSQEGAKLIELSEYVEDAHQHSETFKHFQNFED